MKRHWLSLATAIIIAGFFIRPLIEHLALSRVPNMIEASYAIIAVDMMDGWVGKSLVDMTYFGLILSIQYYPPFYIALLAVAFALFGVAYSSVLWINIPLAALTLAALYATGKLVGNKTTGLLAMLFFAGAPAMGYALGTPHLDFAMTCFAAISFYFLVGYLRFGHARWLIGYGAFLSAGLMTRWTLVLFPMAIGISIVIKAVMNSINKQERPFRPVIMMGATSAIAALPLLIWLFTQADIQWLRTTAGTREHQAALPFFQNLLVYPKMLFFTGLGFSGIVAALSFFNPKLWRSRWTLHFLAWLLVGLIAFTIIPTKKPQYIYYLYPSVCLMAALSIGRIEKRHIKTGVCLIVLLLSFVSLVIQFQGLINYDPSLWVKTFETIENHWQGKRLPRVMLPNRYYAFETDFNAIVAAFENAALANSNKIFLEGYHNAKNVYEDRCEPPHIGFDYVAYPVDATKMKIEELENTPLFNCFELTFLKAYDLAPYNGTKGQLRIYYHPKGAAYEMEEQ